MFDVASSEFVVLGVVALLVIPPKDLPKAMRVAGYWVGRARGVARQFRSGFDDIIRESEMAEMEKKWREENERIMRDHPPTMEQKAEMLPLPAPESYPVESEESPEVVAQPEVTLDPVPAPAPAKRAAKARKAS